VAVGMHKLTEFSNQISKSDLQDIILKLYRDFPNEILPVKNATQQTKNSLKERLKENNSQEEMVMTDVRSCGILVNDLSKKDYFKFAHKSFFEYLVSFYFVEGISKKANSNLMMVKSIENALGTTISTFEHSKETVAFTAEILATGFKLDASKEENKIAVAYKLFETLYPIKFLSKYPKIAGLVDITGGSRTWSYLTILTGFTISQLVGLVNIKASSGIESTPQTIPKYVILFIPVLLTMFMVFLRSLKKITTSKRGSIWLKCCHQLEIDDSILKRIVAPVYLEYIKGELSEKLIVQKIIRIFGAQKYKE
jgi:hypothetical protein